MRTVQFEVSQLQGWQGLGPGPWKTPQGFSGVLLEALLGATGLSEEPLREISGKLAFQLQIMPLGKMVEGDIFHPSTRALSQESESLQKSLLEPDKSDVGDVELPDPVALCETQIPSEALFLLTNTQRKDGVPSDSSGSCMNFPEFPDISQEQGPQLAHEMGCGTFLSSQEGEAEGLALEKSLGLFKPQAGDSAAWGLFLTGCSRESGAQLGLSAELQDKTLDDLASTPRDADGANLLEEEDKRGLAWKLTLAGGSDKTLGKSRVNWFENPMTPGSSQAQREGSRDLALKAVHASPPSSESGRREEKAGILGRDPEGWDMPYSRFNLNLERPDQASVSEQLQLDRGASEPLRLSESGVPAQKAAGMEGWQQLQPAAQFSGDNQGLSPEAPKTNLSKEATAPAFRTDVEAQAQTDRLKDPQVVHMQMEPPDLGLLRVRLKVHKEGVEALFLTQGLEQKAALEQGLPQLRQSLAEQGFLSQRLAVDVGGGGAQWTSQGKPDHGLSTGTLSLGRQDTPEKNQESYTTHKEHGILHLRI